MTHIFELCSSQKTYELEGISRNFARFLHALPRRAGNAHKFFGSRNGRQNLTPQALTTGEWHVPSVIHINAVSTFATNTPAIKTSFFAPALSAIS